MAEKSRSEPFGYPGKSLVKDTVMFVDGSPMRGSPEFFSGGTVLFMVKLASLMLIFMGSMDCLTTVIGTIYFGTQELNPIIAGLVHTNLPAFVVLKLAVTVSVGVVFILAEKALLQNGNLEDRAFRVAHRTLRIASVGIVLFLFVVVLNNIIVLLRTL